MKAPIALLLAAVCACSREDAAVGPAEPSGGLAFAYVDVAGPLGYRMRNRSGKDGFKEFIIEAMPPGIAVEDFDGDGWMDMYCPNGGNIVSYDRATRTVAFLPPGGRPRDALYWNRGGRRFEDGAKAAGVDDDLWSFGAVAGDVDNDGDPDLYLCNFGTNRLFLNRGDGTFRDATEEAGAGGDPRHWSTAAILFDYDGDGDLDLYVAQYADVYGILDDETITKILPDGTLHGRNCDWRKLQVYCGPLGLPPLNDVLFENRLADTGELRFVDVTQKAGLWIEPGPTSRTDASRGPWYAFQPVAWDIDGDGLQDVFVANDSVPNACWMNRGDGTFENRALEMGLAMSQADSTAQASMGVGLGDVNRDGLQDLVITEFSHDQFNLLLCERLPNGAVVFEEKAHKTGMREMTMKQLGWGAFTFDPDHDMDEDVFFACGHVYPEVDRFPTQETSYAQTNLLILNEDPSRPVLRDVSATAGPGLAVRKVTRAAVRIDFDNDGDVDIATTELNDTPSLLRCDLPRSGGRNWIQIRLRGNPERRVPMDPAGAVVTVEAGKVRQSKLFCLGSSFQSSEDPRLHFGLGPNASASVEILWPNGERTRHEVAANRLHEIRLR